MPRFVGHTFSATVSGPRAVASTLVSSSMTSGPWTVAGFGPWAVVDSYCPLPRARDPTVPPKMSCCLPAPVPHSGSAPLKQGASPNASAPGEDPEVSACV